MKLYTHIILLPSLPNSLRYTASTLHFQRSPVLGESGHFTETEYSIFSLPLSECYTLRHRWRYWCFILQNGIILNCSITCFFQAIYVVDIIPCQHIQVNIMLFFSFEWLQGFISEGLYSLHCALRFYNFNRRQELIAL